MPDLMPAPGCTSTSAPSPIIFLTVSGVAATRGSDGSASAPTAIFIMPPTAARMWRARGPRGGEPDRSGQKISHSGDDQNDEAAHPLHQRNEVQVGLLVRGVVVAFSD